MKILLVLFSLIPSLSWGLTFKDGKQVDDKNSIDSLLIEINENDLRVPKNYYTNDELIDEISGNTNFINKKNDSFLHLFKYHH